MVAIPDLIDDLGSGLGPDASGCPTEHENPGHETKDQSLHFSSTSPRLIVDGGWLGRHVIAVNNANPAAGFVCSSAHIALNLP